jgi:hypothetical protein
MGGQGSAITQVSPLERAGLCGRKGTTRRNSALDTLENQNVAKTPFNFPYLRVRSSFSTVEIPNLYLIFLHFGGNDDPFDREKR